MKDPGGEIILLAEITKFWTFLKEDGGGVFGEVLPQPGREVGGVFKKTSLHLMNGKMTILIMSLG